MDIPPVASDAGQWVLLSHSAVRTARWLTLALALVAAGCAGLSYKEPADGPRARVRFSTNAGLTIIRGYGDSGCATDEAEWMRLQNAYAVNSPPKRLGMPLWEHHENAAKEVYVDAATEKTFLIILDSPYGGKIIRCGVPLSYKFSQGKDYEVAFSWEPNRLQSGPGQCRVDINLLESTGSAARRVRLTRFPNALTTKNDSCVNQFTKIRLY